MQLLRKSRPAIITLVFSLMLSCDDFSLIGELDGPAGSALTVAPSEYQLPVNHTLVLTVTGGYPGYGIEIIEGGGAVNAETLTFTAPGTPGNVVIRVTDGVGEYVDVRITVTEPIIGNTGVEYTVADVVVTGGTITESAISGTFAIANNGSAAGSYDIRWRVYASTDTTVGGSDFLVATGSTSALAAGGSREESFSGVWPAVRGAYYIVVRIDSLDDETASDNEASTTNPTTITDPPPADVDYVVLAVTTADASAAAGSPLAATFTYRNRGSAGGEDPVYWSAYTSLDEKIDGSDAKVASGVAPALPAGESSESVVIDEGAWPDEAGIYYLIIELSAPDETAVWNNTGISGGVAVNAASLDYIVTDVSRKYPTVVTGDPLREQFDLRNASTADGAESVSWRVYVSAGTSLDGEETLLGSGTVSAVAAGAESTQIDLSGTWSVAAGTYWLIVDVSSADEDIPDNNTFAAGPFTVNDPPNVDYTNILVSHISGSAAGRSFAGYFTVENTGTDDGAAPVCALTFCIEDTG